MTPAGTGQLIVGQEAVTRWRRDPTADGDGLFLYLRDLATSEVWSAGWQPIPLADAAATYDVFLDSDVVQFQRNQHGIRCRLSVQVATHDPVEFRTLWLANESAETRHIEITSYAELVLQAASSFESHPVFSKLFLETEWDANRVMVFARRRTRLPGERTLKAAHWIMKDRAAARSACEWETDRCRWIGRGRSLNRPLALSSSQPLSGTTGGVLDPIFSIRSTIVLPPQGTASIVFAMAASHDEQELRALAESVRCPDVWHPLDSDRSIGVQPPQGAVDFAGIGRPLAADGCHAGNSVATTTSHDVPLRETWQFDNGWGGFSADGCEYVMQLRPDVHGDLRLPPRPWTHVVANPHAGTIMTERGALATWTSNSRENRLTPWSNDPVTDPCQEVLYLREPDRRTYWSPLPGPLARRLPLHCPLRLWIRCLRESVARTSARDHGVRPPR